MLYKLGLVIQFFFIFHLTAIHASGAAAAAATDKNENGNEESKNRKFKVTKNLIRHFKDELIKVALYHELIVKRENQDNVGQRAQSTCAQCIKDIRHKIHDIVDDPITFADLYNNSYPTAGLCNIAKEVNRLEKDAFDDADTYDANAILNNEIIFVFAHNHFTLQDEALLMTDASVMGKINLFKYGLFVIYLKSQLAAMVQCAEILTMLKDGVQENKWNVTRTLESIEELAKDVKARIKSEILHPTEGSSTSSHPYRFIKTRFLVKEMLTKDPTNTDCSAIEWASVQNGMVYDCANTDYQRLKYKESTVSDDPYYKCLVDGSSRQIIFGDRTCNSTHNFRYLDDLTSPYGFCRCIYHAKPLSINKAEVVADISRNEFVTGIQLNQFFEEKLDFSLKLATMAPLKNLTTSPPSIEKVSEDPKWADVSYYDSVFQLDELKAPNRTVITGVRMKPDPIRLHIQVHDFDFITGTIITGTEQWIEGHSKANVSIRISENSRDMSDEIVPEIVNDVLESGLPLSSISLRRSSTAANLIEPAILPLDFGWYFDIVATEEEFEEERKVQAMMILGFSGVAVLFLLLGVIFLKIVNRTRYDTPPPSRPVTPEPSYISSSCTGSECSESCSSVSDTT